MRIGGCVAAYGLVTLRREERRRRMYRVWYWAMVDRETDGRFIASIPDLGDLAAYGENEKGAVAHVAELAAGHVRAIVESGQPAPRARKAAELPSAIRSKEVGRSLIPVEVGRAAAKPGMSSNVSEAQ
jgi:predicted RNase H-like HicB family nuclease